MPRRLQFAIVTAALAATAVSAAACTGPAVPTASGDTKGTSLVLAVPDEPTSLNPLAGYAESGAAKIFDGLVEHDPGAELRPALATALPVPSADGRSWTVHLRTGVHFTDGTDFDAQDVLATYHALLDPAFASPIRDRYRMISAVTAVDATTVRFDLAQPYAPFLDLLVLGILPSEALATPAPVTRPDFKPVGTGPYQLVERHSGGMVLQANTSYFDGPPKVTKVTVEYVPNDEDRAARMREGKYDGVALPPAEAQKFENVDPFTVINQRSADVRAVTLPTASPVTADPALRLALNYAVNRRRMVDSALAGKGSEAHTPVPSVLAETVEPTARFTYDLAKARRLLDEAGWTDVAGDGVRAKAGVPAKFTLWYPSGDLVARDLAAAFVADAKAVGIEVSAQPLARAEIAARSGTDATLVSSGDPFDPDLGLYPLLHSSTNVDASVAGTVDDALEAGRADADPAQRTAQYRKLQRAYVTAPGMVTLVAVDHTYVMRENWAGYQAVVDGPRQDGTWGPWWNLQRWAPR